MDFTIIIAAAIAATPPTLAVVAQGRSQAKRDAVTKIKVDQINHAVNHQPDGAPTLVQRVGTIEYDVGAVKADVADVKVRVQRVEQVVG